jgi:glutathione peroxidase
MTVYDFNANRLDGKPVSLDDYRGRVALVVNVASHCGYTPQYSGLEALYRRHKDEGFVVLGFPCNQFGAQEPGSSDEIASFCSRTYDVTFPMFSKVDVNGPNEHPLFTFLKKEKPGALGTKSIKWNFTKFLVGRDGQVLKRYGSSTTPDDIDADVVAALAEGPA